MREHTLSLEAQGGDQIAEEHLAGLLRLRAGALSDDGSTRLFFGRLDMHPDLADSDEDHRWYIGRRHVSDAAGDPVVVDWRARVCTAFYHASPAEPMGVRRRRRFGIEGGELTASEDEHLITPQADDATGHSRILATEIERPRSGPMRDIVATIQPEQDEIVRSDVARTVCVQGAPGTGKTAVGLHRAAWLLYAYRERLARSGVLVIGPNRTFLEHVGAVLPSLGEISVRHTMIDELTAAARVRAQDPARVAVLKGDARMAQLLRRAVCSGVGPVTEPLVLPQRLAHAVLLRMERSGDSPDDRVQDAIARSAPVRAYVKGIWPTLDPGRVLWGLWSSPDNLAAAADGLLSEAELADLIERTPSLGHIVVDEAQRGDDAGLAGRHPSGSRSTAWLTWEGIRSVDEDVKGTAGSEWLVHPVQGPALRTGLLRSDRRLPDALAEDRAHDTP